MKTTTLKFRGTESGLKLELDTLRNAGIGIWAVTKISDNEFDLIAPIPDDNGTEEFWNNHSELVNETVEIEEVKKEFTYIIESDDSINTNDTGLIRLMESKINIMSGQDYLSYKCKWYNEEFGILQLELSFYNRSVKFYYDTLNNCKCDMRTKEYKKIKRVG